MSLIVSGASSIPITFVRILGMSILPPAISSSASSNSPALVLAPRTSSSFFVIVPVAIDVSFFGHPVRMMRPALHTASNALLIAAFEPEASIGLLSA